MKHAIVLLIMAGLLAAGLPGCSAGPAPRTEKTPPVPGKTVEKGDLLQRRFLLKSADGIAVSAGGREMELLFTEDPDGPGLRVSGGICNRFFGQGSLENGLLTVKQMASTRMLCPGQELDTLENTFVRMFQQGAGVSLEGATLTLRQGEHELIYEAAGGIR